MAEPASTAPSASTTSFDWLTLAWWGQQVWLHHLIAAAFALILAFVLWRVVSRGLTLLCRRTVWLQELELLVMRAARWSYWLLATLFILQQAGVDTGSLWTAATAMAAMVAVGFVAVWSILSNLVASVLILATRLFRPRDDLELMDAPGGVSVRGTVRSVDLMFTVIEEKREDGSTALVKVPNNLFFQKVVRVRE